MAEMRRIRVPGSHSSDFVNPQEYSRNLPIHAAIYGRNGVGKTTFAGTTGLRTVLLDCSDSGAITLRNQDPKKLKIVKIRSILHYLDIVGQVFHNADDFDLLVADTVTGLQSLAIQEVKGKRVFEMNQRKWGSVGARIIECLTETRNFPKDVLYLIQEKRSSGEDEQMEIGPALTPSVKGFLNSKVDWMGRLSIDSDGNRFLDFRLTDTHEAKDRAGLFPRLIGKPSYRGIRKRIITQLGEMNNGE